MEKIFMNTENSEINVSNNFFANLLASLNLKNPNKNIELANLSFYYTWKNIRFVCNNNKFKSSAPIWNDEFDLPDGSYSISDIQYCFEYIIKNITL